ncbi:hypothetical protein [Streptomyces sp. NPDC051214]|uniref:hypothetical protein n=1 Tax=Streptomyces sp. NPDC051214 TaxID=3155282 RepID=UPI003447A36C
MSFQPRPQLQLYQYAQQLLTADLARPRFTGAAEAFADEHGAAFVEECGSGSPSQAA